MFIGLPLTSWFFIALAWTAFVACWLIGWSRGLPPAANHSRIWKQAKLDRELRNQVAHGDSPAMSAIDFHSSNVAQGAARDHV